MLRNMYEEKKSVGERERKGRLSRAEAKEEQAAEREERKEERKDEEEGSSGLFVLRWWRARPPRQPL